MMDLSFLSLEYVAAICAIFISVASLIVAIGALNTQREHNYLSVRPIAHFSRGDYENCVFVKLKNFGLGPLLIDRFIIQTRHGSYKRMIDAFTDIAHGLTWDTFTDSIDGRALAPNAEFILVKATFDDTQNAVRENVRAALSEMNMQLYFKDIYDRPQPVLTEDLLWFARHQ